MTRTIKAAKTRWPMMMQRLVIFIAVGAALAGCVEPAADPAQCPAVWMEPPTWYGIVEDNEQTRTIEGSIEVRFLALDRAPRLIPLAGGFAVPVPPAGYEGPCDEPFWLPTPFQVDLLATGYERASWHVPANATTSLTPLEFAVAREATEWPRQVEASWSGAFTPALNARQISGSSSIDDAFDEVHVTVDADTEVTATWQLRLRSGAAVTFDAPTWTGPAQHIEAVEWTLHADWGLTEEQVEVRAVALNCVPRNAHVGPDFWENPCPVPFDSGRA